MTALIAQFAVVSRKTRLVKKAKASEDTIYTRNNLQKVDVNTLEKIPTKQKNHPHQHDSYSGAKASAIIDSFYSMRVMISHVQESDLRESNHDSLGLSRPAKRKKTRPPPQAGLVLGWPALGWTGPAPQIITKC